MKKSVFLCQKPENITRVFGTEGSVQLSADEKVYTKAEVISDPDAFRNTEFIFSTWGMEAFCEEEIKALFPSLRAVFYAAGSVQHFARPFLNVGVEVFSAWRANAIPVAEYTLAQILLANKGFYASSGAYKAGGFSGAAGIFRQYRGNYGATVGIIGAGMIGKKVAELLKPFSLKLLVYDAFLSAEQIAALGGEKVTLEELFERCEVISNHLADNAQTKGMLGYELFSEMKPNATFINTGRGAQVREDELVRILKEREDIVALLDVTYPEPVRAGHPFYELTNCILTPHIAGSSGDEVRRMGEYAVQAYRDFVNSVPNDGRVTLEMLKTMA